MWNELSNSKRYIIDSTVVHTIQGQLTTCVTIIVWLEHFPQYLFDCSQLTVVLSNILGFRDL